MKVTRNFSVACLFGGLICGLLGLVVLLVGVPYGLRLFRNAVSGGMLKADAGDLLPLAGAVLLAIGFAGCAGVALFLWRKVAGPAAEAARFADRLAGGEEMPAPLSTGHCEDDAICTLFAALNFLRDRQQNLAGKLKMSISREAEVRREIERHESLQLRLLTRMLPEMRQPLGTLKGFALVLRLELDSACPDPVEIRRLLDGMIRRIGSLSRQIERTYDISQLGRDRWSVLKIESFKTTDFIRELTELNGLSLQAREVTLVNRFSASAPQMLRIDRGLLLQLLNILIRAVGRAAAIGETVVLSCYTERHLVVFEVRDSRRGECREELAKNYQEYMTSADSDSPVPGGTGLGVLALCFARDIAGKIAGRLVVESTPESHTVLKLEFDEKDCVDDSKDHREEHFRVNRSGQLPPSTSEAEANGEKPKLRVLLGNDNQDDVMILTRLLAPEGISVFAVDSAEAMVRAAKGGDFDGFLLTAPFRNCDPVELIQSLRQAVGRREAPAVVITTQITEESFLKLSELDRVWSMTLPLNFDLLARLIRHAAGRQHG